MLSKLCQQHDQLVKLQFTSKKKFQKPNLTSMTIREECHRILFRGRYFFFFLLMTNDLRTYLLAGECQTVIYADDTVITPRGKTNERLTGNVHDVYIKTKEYCSSNSLALNQQKTVQVVFNTKNKLMDAKLARLNDQTNTQHLEVEVDVRLT